MKTPNQSCPSVKTLLMLPLPLSTRSCMVCPCLLFNFISLCFCFYPTSLSQLARMFTVHHFFPPWGFTRLFYPFPPYHSPLSLAWLAASQLKYYHLGEAFSDHTTRFPLHFSQFLIVTSSSVKYIPSERMNYICFVDHCASSA